ncbi:serine hydrolase [Streptomyces sp. A73]|uniref:serine hydrolase n=1 Tax=Streptomyces TaxID=1883 RepID=UPI000C1883D2|nr:serine hydrolase [Streptomyces sp. RK75]MBQ0867164.1 serine hydrolase [Streptomyces sp. RK75]MBQ1159153.1 serine hydrolase [Streptomyces sp. A73]
MRADQLLRELRQDLRDGGLTGSFLVRDLRTGQELGIDPDTELPVASLVKVPLAVATLDRIRRGELDGARQLEVPPGGATRPGPIGITRFRHPARVALEDLIYLSTSLSDNAAANALFGLTPPAAVDAVLRGIGVKGITVRHALDELTDTPAEQLRADATHLAHSLAIAAGTGGHGHQLPQLDVTRTNAGTARAFVDLLQALWTPSAVHPDVAARIRSLMADNVVRQRLAPDFSSDSATWASKTGTLLNLRHEVGVVQHADGAVFAVAALTESQVAAAAQPGAEALMAQVARELRDHLRHG